MRQTILRAGLCGWAAVALALPTGTALAQTTAAPATGMTAPGDAATPSPEAMRLATEIIAKTTANRDASIRAMSAPLAGTMQQFGIHDPVKAKTMVDEVITPMLTAHIQELFDLQAKSYATTLTIDDLKGLAAFYETPAGQDVIAKQPQLSSNLVSNTTQWLRALSPELQQRMQTAIKAHGWDKETPPQ